MDGWDTRTIICAFYASKVFWTPLCVLVMFYGEVGVLFDAFLLAQFAKTRADNNTFSIPRRVHLSGHDFRERDFYL